MAALDLKHIKTQLEERLGQIDTELDRLSALQTERAEICNMLRAGEGPISTTATNTRVPWTKELLAYIDIQTGLGSTVEIIDGICKKLGIEKTDTINRTIRSVLSKQHAEGYIGSISDFETKKPLFGPKRFFSDPNTLRLEFQHLAKVGKG